MEHIVNLKRLIENHTLADVKDYLASIDISEIYNQSDFIFQKVYLHVCLLIGKHKRKNNKSMVDKLIQIELFLKNECFSKLPELQRIAIRQCFPYGKHLMM
jgi:hypothetical protein